jgi:hypothetical protein
MGMFDYLYINTDKLPVSDEEKKLFGKKPDWQTKDLDCTLTKVIITDDGLLQTERFNYKIVPKEERPHPNDDGIMGLIGSFQKENITLETLDYDGIINFYCDFEGKWYEFYAKFTDGRLVSITGGLEKC